MQLLYRVRAVWSWLPAFRVVAETEHLPTAAQQLGLVPSSLSRTIKLLEDELGVTLFERTGKALVLNDAGRHLLVSVRDAMRVLDEAIGVATADDLRGNVVAAACSDLATAILVPACAAVVARCPQLCASTVVASADAVGAMLLRGDIDAALVVSPIVHPELQVVELATWTRGVYGRAGTTIGATSRCVAVGTPSHPIDDGWPLACERTIAAWTHDEHAALALCLHTDLITVAFDALAGSRLYADTLIRLQDLEIASRTIYLLHRRAIGTHRRTDALTSAIRDVLRT